MASLNKVMIIGNLGRDPEMRFVPSGDPVTAFSVAVNENFTGRDGSPKSRVEWFNVVTWNRLAETTSQYLSKGKMVYVEGRLQTRSWEDAEGNKHQRVELVASTVQFLSLPGAKALDPAEQIAALRAQIELLQVAMNGEAPPATNGLVPVAELGGLEASEL